MKKSLITCMLGLAVARTIDPGFTRAIAKGLKK